MVEWTKIVADWLADATNGVNALLAGVPRYTGHTLPPNVTIYNEIEHGFVARGFISEDSPMASAALLVYELDGADVDVIAATEQTDATVTVVVGVPIRLSDTADAIRRAKYTLRAVDRSLIRLNDSMPYGLVHGVELIEPVRRRWLAPFKPHEGALFQLGLASTFTFRDNQPRG
jgi:hypothetical protein